MSRTQTTKWFDVVKLSASFLALALALTSTPARADNPAEMFAKVNHDAVHFEAGLSQFLDRFIGECSGAEDQTCRQSAQHFREENQGKKFHFNAPEESAALLEPEPENPSDANLYLDLTPFFGAGGYALTNGAPKKTDAQGNPVLTRIRLRVQIPEDRSWNDVVRMVATRSVRVELVATPRAIWGIKRARGGKGFGVNADLNAVLVVSSRTGDPVAIWTRSQSVGATATMRVR